MLDQAQSSSSSGYQAQPVKVCPRVEWKGRLASGVPAVSVVSLSFSGFLQMPVSDQDEIATTIKQQTYSGAPDNMSSEIEEMVRREWQNRGYFTVQANARVDVVSASTTEARIAVTVHVDEGPQYRLGKITFRNNDAVTNVEALRNLFPIKDGAVFSREAVAKGLENLRKTYTEFGYINSTSVPETRFNERNRTISLDIDIQEGKQFYVSSITVGGADAQVLDDLALKPGQIYNSRLIELFLKRDSPGVDADDPSVQRKVPDERRGTVALTLNLTGCPPE